MSDASLKLPENTARAWVATLALTIGAFLAAALAFFALIGQPPIKTLLDLFVFAAGDPFSRGQTLLKAAPIVLCALAAAIPGRLGLISVGAEGQLHAGAITGTAVMLIWQDGPAPLLLPAVLLAGVVGGALWGGIAGYLRARLDVNETIVTLVLNYVAVLMVNALVFGAWRDPGNQGWPATVSFPDAAIIPDITRSGAHAGLILGILLALAAAWLFWRGIFADRVRLLQDNRKVSATFGLDFGRYAILLMLAGGGVAGLSGIVEASAVQGRLQPGLSLGYGLTGFLVAWLCGHRFVAIIPVSLLIGGLIAAGDSLQLFAKVPAASATVLQGLLFFVVLVVPGLLRRWRAA